MVPPQHYPAAFPQEFNSARTPTMMTPDSSADTRSDRLSLDMGSVHQHHHHLQQQEYSHHQLHNQPYHNGQSYHSPPYPLLPTPLEEHGQNHTNFANQDSFMAFEQHPDQTENGSKDAEIALVPGDLNDGRLKRMSRHVSVDIPPNPLAPVAREVAGMPAKKKAKTDTSKKGENDTASLFQKIFADRDPGKRKIRTKSVSEIPMDLGADEDDSDFEDTKMDSNDEDEDMIMPEDAASEDEIKPDQQEAMIDEQDLLTVLWQWKDNDPEVCCVCLGRSTEADNVFVYCDTLDCALCVHQACYGVKTLPSESEPWLCDRCKAPPEEVVSCVCCPSKDGAFRRLIPEDPSGGWVHVVCALWLPETTLGDPDNVDRISVRDIPEKNWNLTCYMCKDPVDGALGACVQCDAGQCRKSFHVTCAQSYSLLETLEDSDMADPYFMYCKQHGSTDGQAKLNGWAKWVKQRDAFLSQWQLDQGRKRTQRLIDLQQQRLQRQPDQSNYDELDESGEGLVELFEHTYSRFKQARERRIARERSELSRQYSIGYYLENKIEKTRSRLEVVSSKAEQALQERMRIETYTRNLLSSLLECANYLESVSSEELVGETPLSIDTTLSWYNSLPDTSRWKSSIQDIIQTIDFNSLGCDYPFGQSGGVHFANGVHGPIDSGFDDSEGGQRQGRSSKGVYSKMAKKGSKATSNPASSTTGHGKNAKSKKVHPKPVLTSKGQIPVVFTSSRGRLIKRDYPDHDDISYSSQNQGVQRQQQQYGYHPGGDYGSAAYSTSHGYPGASSNHYQAKAPRPILPCTVCHQLTLPEEKLALERDSDGMLTPMAIKVLNRMVTCDTCQRPYHPKCLDPPMARVPPRGYSWNCEDCDSSDDSHHSGSEGSPAMADHHGTNAGHHHHTHSSDMEEALMFLADTALTVSTTPYGGTTGSSSTARKSTTTHGQKRPHVATTIRMPDPVGPMPRSGMPKKVKIEGAGSRKSANLKDAADSEVEEEDEDMEENEDEVRHPKPRAIQPKGANASKSASVAPIIRGNLRIYPPGPNIAPKVSPALLNLHEQTSKPGHKEGAKKAKSTAQSIDSPTTAKAAKGTAAVKKEGAKAKSTTATLSKTSKVKAEPAKTTKAAGASKGKKGAEAAASAAAVAVPTKAKGVKAAASTSTASKKTKGALKDIDAAVKSEPVSDTKVTKRRKSVSITACSPTSPTSPVAGASSGKEKATPAKSAARRGSLPAVPPEPTPPPKEVIRYTVGEKTVEELTAKEDVEIERRDNVKFRKLRGRTLTMPAPPQDGVAPGPDTVASMSS